MYSANGFETGVIYRDDNLERLRSLPSECVDLIYLDPPFFSNRTYEVIWGDEAEVRSFKIVGRAASTTILAGCVNA